MASFKQPPKELILDSDTTDDAVHGKQAGRFFHGYYDHYCFLPWHVFCQDQLPVGHLRPSNIDEARHAGAILSLLIKRFRQSWPGVSDNQRAMAAIHAMGLPIWPANHSSSMISFYSPGGEMESRIKEHQLDLFADRTSCHRR